MYLARKTLGNEIVSLLKGFFKKKLVRPFGDKIFHHHM